MPGIIRDPRPNNVNSSQKKFGVAYSTEMKTHVYYNKENDENSRFLPAGVKIELSNFEELKNPVPFDNSHITHVANVVEINEGNLNSQKVLKHVFDNLQEENKKPGGKLNGHFDKFDKDQ